MSAFTLFSTVLLLSILLTADARPTALKSSGSGQCAPSKISSVTFAGEFHIESGMQFRNSTVGGLSAITYDPDRDVYYLLCDDRETAKHRFYTARIDVDEYTVSIIDVTYFVRSSGAPFAGADLDPEGLEYSDAGTLFMSSERDLPAIFEFGLDGKLIRYFNVPDYYMPNRDGSMGTRSNLGFEGLSLSPDGRYLWGANEGALAQDGEKSTLNGTSPCRFVSFSVRTGNPVDEFVYVSDKIARAPVPATGFADNGVTEIVALSDRKGGQPVSFLVMERSFSFGSTLPDRGFTVRLYETSTYGARNVRGMDTAPNPFPKHMQKRLLADITRDFGVFADNLEGLQLVKTACGQHTLIVMSDDNFSAFGPQSSQFLFLNVNGHL